MVFLINASNIKNGGGLQVANSICGQLCHFKKHKFIVVISSYINISNISFDSNVEVLIYDVKHDVKSILLGRDDFLDEIFYKKNVDAVLTIFGPSIWRPRGPHLCGFARAQLVLKDSPYFNNFSLKDRIIFRIWDWAFKHSSDVFYTENPYISKKLENTYKNIKVYTISNYYNQIYDNPQNWISKIELPPFDGITCLSVSSPSIWKNFKIIEGIIRHLRRTHPSFRIRFVLTFSEHQLKFADDVRQNVVYVGKVDFSECPNLYKCCDIMFMPTLMECFTATYPEAMKMERPIVTTDLEFAHVLCGEAACYYDAIDPIAAANAIFKVATNLEYRNVLVENGKKQLMKFDNYERRAEKLIALLEEMANK